jgi:uncharacterized Rossmann fold enzyme
VAVEEEAAAVVLAAAVQVDLVDTDLDLEQDLVDTLTTHKNIPH